MSSKNTPRRQIKSTVTTLNALYQTRTLTRLAENTVDLKGNTARILHNLRILSEQIGTSQETEAAQLKSEVLFLRDEIDYWRSLATTTRAGKGEHDGK